MFQHLSKTKQYIIHFGFWLVYYLLFSLIWARDGDLYSSFYLEFIYMPVRILLSYALILFLIPKFFERSKFPQFFGYYFFLLVLGSMLQRLFFYFFFEGNTTFDFSELINLNSLIRTLVLLNSTALFVGSVKIADLYLYEKRKNTESRDVIIELKSNRRVYRVSYDMISHIEGMGNYVVYYLEDGRKLVVYQSLKKSLQMLNDSFIRPHKSYIINKEKVLSYDNEVLEMKNGIEIPISKNIDTEKILNSA